MTNDLDEAYWSQRYEANQTGWDIGAASPQLLDIAAEFPKSARILIPGCGRAWEAEILHRQGYTSVFVSDWSMAPLDDFLKRCANFPKDHLLHGDFFELHRDFEASFDLILEQTFFCALPPSRRDAYVAQCHRLLKLDAYLGGLLFDFPLTDDGPPFGGSKREYEELFHNDFHIEVLTRSKRSIPPRAGNELYMLFRRM